MGIKERERRVEVFFYGLFMDEELVHGRGLEPEGGEIAAIDGFAGIPGPSSTFFGSSEGHDSAVVSAGVSVQWTPAITTYVSYDGQLGRGNYDSNAVTGGVRISF